MFRGPFFPDTVYNALHTHRSETSPQDGQSLLQPGRPRSAWMNSARPKIQ